METRGRSGLIALIGVATLGCPRAQPGVPAVELRAALLLAYPEYRGTRLTFARAEVARTHPGDGAEVQAFCARVGADGFDAGASEPGACTATRPPFEVHAYVDRTNVVEGVALPLSADDVQRAFGTQRSPTSETLERLLPPAKPGTERRFTLELRYTAEESRARFLVWQLVHGLLLAGWRSDQVPEGWETTAAPDGGRLPLPEDERLLLGHLGDRATLALFRQGGTVDVRLDQPLR
jgi:hypothetical protein